MLFFLVYAVCSAAFLRELSYLTLLPTLFGPSRVQQHLSEWGTWDSRSAPRRLGRQLFVVLKQMFEPEF